MGRIISRVGSKTSDPLWLSQAVFTRCLIPQRVSILTPGGAGAHSPSLEVAGTEGMDVVKVVPGMERKTICTGVFQILGYSWFEMYGYCR